MSIPVKRFSVVTDNYPLDGFYVGPIIKRPMKPRRQILKDRRRKMLGMKERGFSYSEITPEFNLIKQRIGQIVSKYYPPVFAERMK
jgi:hypothetical protein